MSTVITAREYLRVSDDKSGQLRSPDEQHGDNERAAAGQGWRLGEPYRENGAVSASRHSHKARPEFDRLLADLAAGRFGAQVLILWESSRGSRRVGEWATLIDRLEDAGVRVFVTTHGRTYDPANGRDRRSLQEDAVDSEYESSKIRDRTTRAMAAMAAEGKPHGRVPYGYRREYRLTPAGKREVAGQVRDPVTAAVVERIFADIGKARSLRSITAGLNAAGVPAPGGGAWTPNAVRDLALNPAYAGLRLHAPGRRSGHDRTRAGTLVTGTWEPIVTPETWYAVRDYLTDPRRRTSRPGRDKHLLSMIAVCGVCGAPLTVRYRRDGAEYTCRASGHVRTPRDGLDSEIEWLMIRRLAEPGEYPHVASRDVTAALQAARDELAAARAHHRQMVELMKARKLSPLAFADAEPAALADVNAAEQRVRSLETPPALAMLLGDEPLSDDDPVADIAGRLADAPMAARREVVRRVFARIALNRAASPGHRPPVAGRLAIEWREDT